RDNAKFRDLITSESYREMWGHVFKVVGDGKVRITNDKTGFKFATSIGGVGTGERGHRVLCLPGDQEILTDEGWLPIGAIVEARMPVRVAGYNHATGRTEWQGIEAYERNPGDEIIEISCEGASLRCTRDHHVFIQGRGYARADSVKKGDRLVWSRRDLNLPSLQERDPTQAKSAPKILQQRLPHRGRACAKPSHQYASLPHLSGAGLPAACASSADTGRALLQPQVSWNRQSRREQSGLRRWQGCFEVPSMWEGIQAKAIRRVGGMLLEEVRLYSALGHWRRKAEADAAKALLAMQGHVYAFDTNQQVLRHELQKRCARDADVRNQKWPLRSWSSDTRVSARLEPKPQSNDQETRRIPVPRMLEAGIAGQSAPRSPYRLRQRQFGCHEPDHRLRAVPRQHAWRHGVTTGVEEAVVVSVKSIGFEPTTYNVRVAPHHNYFVDGLLVHNCDDIHRVKSSESDEARQSTVNWVIEAMQNRLNDLSRDVIVGVMQRTHENDASGAIQKQLHDQYCHLIIPMEYEPGRHFSHYQGWRDGEDPRRYERELAWKDRYPPDVLTSFKRNQYLWSGQYQQNPVPRGGGLFKEHWWQPFEIPRSGSYEWPGGRPLFTIASLDTAFKEKEENDYSALTVWGAYDDPKTGNRRVMMIDAWKKKLPLHGERVQRKTGEDEHTYMRRSAPKWGLVEWVEFTCSRRGVEVLLVEDSARGHDVNNELQRIYTSKNWSIQMIPARGDKWVRAQAALPVFTDEMVYAPGQWHCNAHGRAHCDVENCTLSGAEWRWRDWVQSVIDEMATFPRGAHDDQVDSVTMALNYLRRRGIAIRREERDAIEEDLARYKKPLKPLY
ncbi:MAG: hypothetical protein E6R03_06030, partial [Hyphomicrobiaceae bacterium]